jgi:hypothetical protein
MESIHQTQKNKCSEGEHIIMGKEEEEEEEEVAVYRVHTRKEREKKPCAFDQGQKRRRANSSLTDRRGGQKREEAPLSHTVPFRGVAFSPLSAVFICISWSLSAVWGTPASKVIKLDSFILRN